MNKFIENLSPDRIFPLNYADNNLPPLVRELKPTVYADTPEKTVYCCILGEDPQVGTFGCGLTPEEAMKDWERNYRKDQQELSRL